MNDSKKERRGLGRGLSALMADVGSSDSVTETTEPRPSEQVLPIERIEPNADQPRKSFDDDELEELARSIEEKGVIQPLIVRQHPEKSEIYQIVAGERRWRAAQLANLHELPVLVRNYTETEVLEIAIIENIQRSELNAIEEAAGYRQLMDRFGHTQEKIAEALGKSRSHIANSLRLLNLPDEIQTFVRDGKLSAGHARALVTADDPVDLAKKIIKGGLSVRAAEKLAKDPTPNTKPNRPIVDRDADTVALENDLTAAVGLKIRIDHKQGAESGKLSVEYDNLDDLDRICSLLSAVR
ncbi:MAG: ParB/RepB/Spo0J family partition protein [Pseudomonadota bacterium]